MTQICTIIIFLIIYPAQAVDFSGPSFLAVKSGDHVTLYCPFADIKTESVVWYKQNLGLMPQKVGEKLAYKDVKIKILGFEIKVTSNGMSLTIPSIKNEHRGLYYCEKCMLENVTLSNGTFLDVTDDSDVNVTVWQRGELDPVPAGASVTLQCSVLSESRAAELQVLWFRAATPQSHPQIIHTRHNSSRQCESVSSTHTCVYNFTKNILSLNDTGTYYCAVTACGRIVFGNGTRVQMVRSLGPVVICLAVVVAMCVLVITAQAFIIWKKRNSDQSKVRSQKGSAAEITYNQGQDAEEVNYAALSFNKTKNTKRMRRKRDQTADCVYSEVKSCAT